MARQNGAGAFPQLRMMALVVLSLRVVLDVAYAPFQGKGSGERTMMMALLKRNAYRGLLDLMDAGLYSFELVWQIHQVQQQDFLTKISGTIKPKFIKQLADGSFLAEITLKVIDPAAAPRVDGRKRWKTLSLTVRVIRVQIPGFRANRPDLVKQELYALLITYNLVRLCIAQAATEHHKSPRFISFLEALHHLLEAIPLLTFMHYSFADYQSHDLRQLIADCEIDRPRRPRTNPRVVKVQSSKFPRKRQIHMTQTRHYQDEIAILPGFASAIHDHFLHSPVSAL